MPTPFYHLNLAQHLLAHQALPAPIQHFLEDQRGAFFFGNTAPDVQSVSGQPREATHFFNVPPRDRTLPWERMLKQYPALKDAANLPPEQVAFLAGYVCHLQADLRWILKLFLPYFGLDARWGRFRHRLYIHNILRTYLDEEMLPGLLPDTTASFSAATPHGWLPFVQDRDLVTWRDFIASQLQPGAGSQTIEVFAVRMGVDPAEINDLLRSEERMQNEVFAHISSQDLIEYRETLITENLALLQAMLGFL